MKQNSHSLYILTIHYYQLSSYIYLLLLEVLIKLKYIQVYSLKWEQIKKCGISLISILIKYKK